VSFRLSDVIKSLGTAEIDVCGTMVRVRSLSAAEHAAIVAQAPDPPPLSSLNERREKVFDPMHPVTVRLRMRRDSKRSALHAGAGCGHTHPTLGPWRPDMKIEEADAYADDVLASASPQALQIIENAMEALSMGVDPSAKPERERIGDGTTPGFSSAPAPASTGASTQGAGACPSPSAG
jgi:hypothetical protein